MKNICLSIVILLTWIVPAAAQDALYAVGPFNNWDAKTPLAFNKTDGVFTLSIDFSDSREFKMSTVSGASSAGNGWSEFDSGALKPVESARIGQWVAIEHNASGNIHAPEQRRLTVQVDVAAMRMRFMRSASAEWSGTLPVLHIDTDGYEAVTSKDNYLNGTFRLDPMGIDGVEAFGSEESPLPLQIRGRGNYTWTGFDKKPYRIKLGAKAALLGMNKSKHFVLLAHADDNIGFMRNTLGFAASEEIKLAWTPAQQPVEVVLNGDYIGLYFLTENIRVDKDRVNVTEQQDLATDDVDGGWLVEIDNYDSDPHVTVYEGSYPIWFTYKSPEELSAQQSSYLSGAMQGIQDAIDAADYAAFTSLVDPVVLARYYIVQEMMNDYESFHGSCYLFRQRGAGERWQFGPVWDFGSALFSDGNDNFIYVGMYHQVWIGAICRTFPDFLATVRDEWGKFLNAGGPQAVVAHGKRMAASISGAAAANYRRWPAYGNENEEASAQVAFSRFESKIEWLKRQWGNGSSIAENVVPGLVITASAGTLLIDSPDDCNVVYATIDGRTGTLPLRRGINSFTHLAPGVYIINHRKIII